ncbi:MAG: hypothetical protein NC300_07640 [Bacteroidales bacterium]|nr:hypothetical protein [Bacteroidales bacterium]
MRWSIVDKYKNEVVGTIELFHRDAKDYFTECGLLRLDIKSDYANAIENILSLIILPSFDMFQCDKIATKVVPEASERGHALEKIKFILLSERLIGYGGTEYEHYFLLDR